MFAKLMIQLMENFRSDALLPMYPTHAACQSPAELWSKTEDKFSATDSQGYRTFTMREVGAEYRFCMHGRTSEMGRVHLRDVDSFR